ncbi:uncharacterized protein LOC133894442 [Phragmites australis]|uniref:uncharacterized protein LOC133894442 n=1 Tax=Phragmites australis TaxID=29695 RepID=UPI002D779063|nr:uncharacterized protein LOC133894442 [Phragmites australis]
MLATANSLSLAPSCLTTSQAAMAGRATTSLALPLLMIRALHARASQLRNCCHFPGAASTPTAFLAALLFCAAAFPRAVAFFLPLVASTSACCAAAYLFVAASERKEVEAVLVSGEGEAEAGMLQVFGDANASAYRRGVQVGCFVRRSAKHGVDEDGEEVIFAGRLVPCASGQHGELEEELVALRVDRLAEGVWNSYFGGWSRWNYHD